MGTKVRLPESGGAHYWTKSWGSVQMPCSAHPASTVFTGQALKTIPYWHREMNLIEPQDEETTMETEAECPAYCDKAA